MNVTHGKCFTIESTVKFWRSCDRASWQISCNKTN